MSRFCPCGRVVTINRGICEECGEIYGYDREEWPEWLRLMVNDITREELNDFRHNEVSYDDEIEPNGRGGYRAKHEFALRGCRTETHLYEDRHNH